MAGSVAFDEGGVGSEKTVLEHMVLSAWCGKMEEGRAPVL